VLKKDKKGVKISSWKKAKRTRENFPARLGEREQGKSDIFI
jgi:hypothetical protein